MKAIYVDFEAWLARRFQNECEDIQELELVGMFKTAGKALEYACEHKIDVAFIDMELPDSDGFTLASKIKTLYPDAGIIFFSAFGEDGIKLTVASDENYYPIILKPYVRDDVENALKAVGFDFGRALE